MERNNKVTLFSYGDGVIIIDDQIKIINQDNRPKYVNNELIGNEGGQFIYEEIDLPLASRKLECEQMLNDEALVAFKEWQDKQDKIEY